MSKTNVRSGLPGAAILALVAVALCSGGAMAQEVPCAGSEAGFPCGFEVRDLALTQTPRLFQLQSRLAQAKLPVGKTTFSTVYVNLLAGTQLVCQEKMSNVTVEDSVLNLTIGQNMSCNLDQAIAQYSGLAFQVCLDSANNCLKPIELATTPYAVKTEFASLVQEAPRANVTMQANYAQRAAASRDMLLRKKVALGYFDFYTHPTDSPAESIGLYSAEVYGDYADGGFVQWTPLSGKQSDRNLHIVGKDDATDKLVFLDELVAVAAQSRMKGDAIVWSPDGGSGLVVTGVGATITGDSDIDGNADVTGKVESVLPLDIHGDAEVQGKLEVLDGLDVLIGGLKATGDSTVTGKVVVDGNLADTGGLQCGMDYDSGGLLTVGSLHVVGGASAGLFAEVPDLVAGSLAVDAMTTVGSLEVTGDAAVAGDLAVTGALEVAGDITFDEHVVFEGGTSEPADLPDPRYVLSNDETRDIAFGGTASLAAGAAFGADLDMQLNQVKNVRIEVASEPPVPCDAAAQGYLYFDLDDKALTVCRDEEYKAVKHIVCGNGFVGPTELCDDGNINDGDGCSKTCAPEPLWSCTSVYVQPTVCTPVWGG